MDFKKWVKSIQTAGYNGARTVRDKYIHIACFGIALIYINNVFHIKIIGAKIARTIMLKVAKSENFFQILAQISKNGCQITTLSIFSLGS